MQNGWDEAFTSPEILCTTQEVQPLPRFSHRYFQLSLEKVAATGEGKLPSEQKGTLSVVWELQSCVDVDKNDDHQVENGPDDAQHGQDALLFTLLVLDSLFFIPVDSVDHFPQKNQPFLSQTNLEQTDKKKKKEKKAKQLFTFCPQLFFFSFFTDGHYMVHRDSCIKPAR